MRAFDLIVDGAGAVSELVLLLRLHAASTHQLCCGAVVVVIIDGAGAVSELMLLLRLHAASTHQLCCGAIFVVVVMVIDGIGAISDCCLLLSHWIMIWTMLAVSNSLT